MGRLDYVLTLTHMRHPRRDASTASRLVRGLFDKATWLSATLRLARPRVGSLDPSYSLALRQKLEHLMRLPTTSYRHGYSCDRHGSNASVKSHFLLPISGWEVKSCHYAHHTTHCFATDHPRGKIRQGPYPTISRIRPYPPVVNPSSTRPRPSLDPPPVSREERQRGTGLRVFSPSRPQRHHGVQGCPAIPRARCYSHIYRIDKTSPQGTPASRPPLTL
jgi:hypothetical protein